MARIKVNRMTKLSDLSFPACYNLLGLFVAGSGRVGGSERKGKAACNGGAYKCDTSQTAPGRLSEFSPILSWV